MVFGVFDGLHSGHLYFLEEAAKYGEVIAVVARDSVVQKLKAKIPRRNENERLRAIREVPFVREAVLGDEKQGVYAVIAKHKPDIICLGYDQDWLRKDLKGKIVKKVLPPMQLIQLTLYWPGKSHTTLLQ